MGSYKHYRIVDTKGKTVERYTTASEAIKRVKELGEDKYKIVYIQ